eukprot:PhM_4_TR16563/c0_g1_i1/m.48980
MRSKNGRRGAVDPKLSSASEPFTRRRAVEGGAGTAAAGGGAAAILGFRAEDGRDEDVGGIGIRLGASIAQPLVRLSPTCSAMKPCSIKPLWWDSSDAIATRPFDSSDVVDTHCDAAGGGGVNRSNT